MQAEFINAVREARLEDIKSFLAQQPVLLNGKDQRGSTALLLATYYGHQEVVDYLLSLKPELDAQDQAGNTALMGVCFKGYYPIAEKLVSAGANVNATNFNGASALIYASMFNKADLVALLLKNKADTTQKDERGFTATDHAKSQGYQEIVDLIASYE
ncbi:ankyrin repeat domain-containing protein [Gilvibacter sediminis]|uniref:ankyrin repeat domain-containing protein n=1 Tax=Gilvibacter sediminis TaxID=379071 RepID=UPI002350851C|nr:ankyrin repeat domain-containing protein [Gilvibacter sediminis]MDC7997102.1 ankyrin repeat domain-containing protein [Gilvibacter sediminis]